MTTTRSNIRPFGPLLEAVKEYRKNEDHHVMNAARSLEEEIITIQQDQMFAGRRADGQAIKPRYAPFTIAEKDRKGQPTDRVTLLDTGAFYEGMYVHFSRALFETDSLDPKTAELMDKYRDIIFGLNRESLEYFINEFYREALQKEFRKSLFG